MCGYETSLLALPRLRFVYVLFTIADNEGTCGQLPVDARFINAQLCLARSLSVYKPHVASEWRLHQLPAAAWFFLRREPLRLEP